MFVIVKSLRRLSVMNTEMNNVLRNSTPNSVPINIPPTQWLNPPQNDLQTESLTAQQVALNDQIRESETNLNAQHKVCMCVIIMSFASRFINAFG